MSDMSLFLFKGSFSSHMHINESFLSLFEALTEKGDAKKLKTNTRKNLLKKEQVTH